MSSTPEAERGGLRERSFGEDFSFTELTLGLFGPSTGAYGEVTPADREALVERAFELGIRSFDVASIWGDSEALLARALGARVREVRVTTRVGRRWEGERLRARFDAASLRRDLEGSLRRLERDQVDLLLLHAPPPGAFRRPGEALGALRELREEGLALAVGATVTTLEQAQAALDAGADALALPVNLLGFDELEAVRGELEQARVGLLATSPLLHGLLADRFEMGHVFPEGDHRSRRWSPEGLKVRLRHVAALRYLAARDDVPSMAVASLRFVLAQREVTTACLGPRTVEQLEELVSHAGEPPYLPPDALDRLPQILAAVGA